MVSATPNILVSDTVSWLAKIITAFEDVTCDDSTGGERVIGLLVSAVES